MRDMLQFSDRGMLFSGGTDRGQRECGLRSQPHKLPSLVIAVALRSADVRTEVASQFVTVVLNLTGMNVIFTPYVYLLARLISQKSKHFPNFEFIPESIEEASTACCGTISRGRAGRQHKFFSFHFPSFQARVSRGL